MKLLFDFAFHALQLGVLRAASLLVPVRDRSQWWQEWYGELWHVRRACIPIGPFSLPAQREVTAFCLGSLRDAYLLRRRAFETAPHAHVHGSAAHCILWLATSLALCAVIAGLLPGVRVENESARLRFSPGLLLVRDAHLGPAVATISVETYRSWNSSRQRFFDALAFYRIARETASRKSASGASWSVAHATPNLLHLLGLPLQSAAGYGGDLPSVILSHEAWTRDFDEDPRVLGSTIRIGARSARVAGVLGYGSWRLPGRPDAFLLESSAALTSASSAPGFVIAHLSALGKAAMNGNYIPIAQQGGDADDPDLEGVALDEHMDGPSSIFLFSLFLALLSLPAVTSVSMSESSFSSHRPSWKRRILRWLFLGAKVVLVAAIAGYASLILAYWRVESYSQAGEFVQFGSSFVICLLGLRWALLDQRKRCPVCLRRVTHPAQVGLASRTFLGWNGTEMICTGGHTLLHVPSLPTSWFSTQRWLYLDTSWEFLFAPVGAP
jgi:hypothetical protein